MRCLQCSAGPFDQPVNVCPRQFHCTDVQRLFTATAPDSDLHCALVGGSAFNLSETRHDRTVDRENEIALLKQFRCRRAAHHPHHRQCLALGRILLGQLLRPLIRQTDLARAGQRLHTKLGLQ